MKTCLFAGPTLHRVTTPPEVTRYGPVALGSVYRAVEAGYERIAIVDGHFGNIPSVWHKEILYALSEGVAVLGAASMGALRAAELWSFGMVGVGRIFRLYRSGRWTDDDEVAVIHAEDELAFCPASDAMANIRFTLRGLRRRGLVAAPAATDILARMKARHFSQRTRDELGRQAAQVLGARGGRELLDAYARGYVDAKRQDALTLFACLERGAGPGPPLRQWSFPNTGHWRWQFGTELADIPPLR